MITQIPLGDRSALTLDYDLPQGAAPWVVFLHGLGSNRDGNKARYLAAQARRRGLGMARFDFRGHGDSTGTLSELTLSRQLIDLGAVLGHLQTMTPAPHPMVLVGSSLGALTSAWHCARAPHTVAGQILIAPAFRIVERYWQSLTTAEQESWRREGRQRFDGPWFSFELTFDCVAETPSFTHEELCANTRLPTWILHGDADSSVPVELSHDFAKRVPAASLEVIAGGDHRLTDHVDQLWTTIERALTALDLAQ